jgi:hypothetical protein
MRKQSVDLTPRPRSGNAFSPNLSLTFAAPARAAAQDLRQFARCPGRADEG